MKAPQYQVGGSSTPWEAFISGCMKAPQYHKFGVLMKNFPMIFHFYDDISNF